VLFTLTENRGRYDHDAISRDFRKNFFEKSDYDVKKRQEYMSRCRLSGG
jgi:hypothetical protein